MFIWRRNRQDLTAREWRLNESTVSRNLRRGFWWQIQETQKQWNECNEILRILSIMEAASLALSYGMFLGVGDAHTELPGFSVSLLAPTLRAEEVPLHTHENASFVLVLAGLYVSTADGAPPVCPAGTLIFNPAGTMHRDSFRLPTGQFLGISISDHTRRIAAEGTALPSGATVCSSKDAITMAFCLAHQSVVSGPESSVLLEGLCWDLLSNVARERLWQQEILPSWLRNARELVHDECSEPLQITGMARQLGVHPVYFARAFRQAFRCTPGEYLTRCRLRKGMALLRDSKLPLSNIALAAGFFDQSHFTKAFRVHFGITPHAYRKRLQ
jgi:AraC family transcriptional regulator